MSGQTADTFGHGAAKGRRILIVDDNFDAADALSQLLHLAGHTVAVANDGESALAKISHFSPQVVLLDIGLPGMDGFEVARRLREVDGGEDLLLLAVTGWGQEEDRQRALAAGFDEHLAKPLESRHLLEVINARPGRPLGP